MLVRGLFLVDHSTPTPPWAELPTVVSSPTRAASDLICRSCLAHITDVDRFCPACGNPNVEARLHPRFPRPLAERPSFEDRSLPEGTPSCRRCHREVADRDPFCRWCGLALDPHDEWGRVALSLAARPEHQRVPYRPVAFVAQALRWMSLLVLAAAVVAALAAFVDAARFSDSTDALTRWTRDTLGWLGDLRSVANAVLVASGLVAAATFVVWARLVLHNADALGASGGRIGPGWVLPGTVIPGLNLVLPKLIVDRAWKASSPEQADLADGRWRKVPVPVPVHLAWGLFLLAWAMLASSRLVDSGGSATDASFAATLDGIALSVLAVSVVLLFLTAGYLGERQERRAARLGLRPVEIDADGEIVVPEFHNHNGETWGRY